MTNEEYQLATDTFALYPPGRDGVSYVILGLASEAGEVAGKLAKAIRGDAPLDGEAVDLEMGDCLWMISQWCNETDTSLSELMYKNIQKLESRRSRNTLQGDGDNR